jgi:hypothetical protein
MFDRKHAGSTVKKVAYTEGIRVGRHNSWFQAVTDNSTGIKAIVGDNRHPDGIPVTVFDMEYVGQFSWREIKEGRV